MGNTQSNQRNYERLREVMPSVDGGSFFDKSNKPFLSDKDRDQFIYATITVLTQNGRLLNLEQHDFRLLYSRRENDRLVARIVAEREGIIKAQIEPHEDGKDQAEAFKALRRHVELALDKYLKDVPGASNLPATGSQTAIAGPSARSPTSRPARPPFSAEVQEPDGLVHIITNNGKENLDDHSFKVMYTLREGSGTRLVARVVALKNGIAAAMVEPSGDGANNKEAFQVLKKEVSVRFDQRLRNMPTTDKAKDASVASAAGSAPDAPPAYSDPKDDGVVDMTPNK
ncbi:uncharacterized protein LTR77_002508 [Saxophila tyrrhenica]|uniref:Uncharacterized protein n=1 Tax=Saxophila tyrrhenica TaxID=1690608 RepID=A0AAV9PIP8_9PEZI|nr:hypothetical protein LTR77_002508 [Saxophila tyrrhenica]